MMKKQVFHRLHLVLFSLLLSGCGTTYYDAKIPDLSVPRRHNKTLFLACTQNPDVTTNSLIDQKRLVKQSATELARASVQKALEEGGYAVQLVDPMLPPPKKGFLVHLTVTNINGWSRQNPFVCGTNVDWTYMAYLDGVGLPPEQISGKSSTSKTLSTEGCIDYASLALGDATSQTLQRIETQFP